MGRDHELGAVEREEPRAAEIRVAAPRATDLTPPSSRVRTESSRSVRQAQVPRLGRQSCYPAHRLVCTAVARWAATERLDINVFKRHRTAALLAFIPLVSLLVHTGPASAATGRDFLGVHISGLPAGVHPSVTITGPRFRRVIRRQGTVVLRHLAPGSYRARARTIRFRGTTRAGALKGLSARAASVTVHTAGDLQRWLSVNYTSGRTRGPAIFGQLAATASALCGLRTDGIVRCWGGQTSRRKADSPPAGKFTTIVGGAGGACGLRPDRSIACWGGGDANLQTANGVGGGSGLDRSPTGREFSSIANVPTGAVACGVLVTGRISCWGAVEINLGTVPRGSFVSTVVLDSDPVIPCGLRADGSASCADGYGAASVPPGSFTTIVGGTAIAGLKPDGSIALSAPSAWTWGSGSGQAGNFTQLTTAGLCGLRVDGSAVCHVDPPIRAGGSDIPGPFTQIVGQDDRSGAGLACGLSANHAVACWAEDSAVGSSPARLNAWSKPPSN